MCGYALPKISEARNLSDEELAQAIIDVKQLFQLRLQKPPTIKWPHQFSNKHRLAQLLSVEHERKLAAATQAASAAVAEAIVGNYGSRKSWQ